MSQEPPIARRAVELRNGLGLHLRSATKFVTLAQRFLAEVRVRHNGRESDGKGVLDLAMLAAERGGRLDLEARGADAEAALDALAFLVDSGFFEDDDGDPVEGGPAALALLMSRGDQGKAERNSLGRKGAAS